MSKKKKFIIISAGRSDYYRYFPIINELNKSKKAKIYIYPAQYYNNKTYPIDIHCPAQLFVTLSKLEQFKSKFYD